MMQLRSILINSNFYRKLAKQFEVGDIVVDRLGRTGKVTAVNIRFGVLYVDLSASIRAINAEDCKRVEGGY